MAATRLGWSWHAESCGQPAQTTAAFVEFASETARNPLEHQYQYNSTVKPLPYVDRILTTRCYLVG
jgi:hypothetical protein